MSKAAKNLAFLALFPTFGTKLQKHLFVLASHNLDVSTPREPCGVVYKSNEP